MAEKYTICNPRRELESIFIFHKEMHSHTEKAENSKGNCNIINVAKEAYVRVVLLVICRSRIVKLFWKILLPDSGIYSYVLVLYLAEAGKGIF